MGGHNPNHLRSEYNQKYKKGRFHLPEFLSYVNEFLLSSNLQFSGHKPERIIFTTCSLVVRPLNNINISPACTGQFVRLLNQENIKTMTLWLIYFQVYMELYQNIYKYVYIHMYIFDNFYQQNSCTQTQYLKNRTAKNSLFNKWF